MKKLFALAALVLGLASCQTEPEGLDVNVGGEVDTTITVSLPDTETRANSAVGAFANLNLEQDSELTVRYIFQVFYNETGVQKQVYYTDGQSASFPVRLVPGRDYNFVAWADIVAEPADEKMNKALPYEGDPDEAHYNTSDLNAITFKSEWKAMNETRDAYTGFYNTADYENNKYTGSSSINIQMTRPFAKLRVLTTDMAELSHLNITPAKGSVTYGKYHYTKFNALTGTAYELATEHKTHNYNIEGYENGVLFVDYFFANDEVVQFYMDVKEANDTRIKENNFSTDIPVKRNYLTTISGNVLTDGNNIEVTVNDAFADADGNEQHIYVYEYNGYINEPLVLSTGAYIFRDVTMNLLSYDNAVIIEENADVTIDVVGKVNLKAAKEAIKVSEGATLTINGMQQTRSNNAQIGEIVADGGIGGNDEGVTIKINDIAHLTAKGHGDHSFGIGGYNANVNINNTTIDYVSGGHVQALFVNDEKYGKSEPEGGAAIGGANVTISKSTITKAEGGSKAAAIGNSYWQSTEVEITNSTLRDIFGGNASAAIGGSRYASDKTTHHSVKVTITDSTITNAVGGQYGAGIGSGYDTHCQAGGEGSTAVNKIIITNSTITAQGGKYAAGIGTGFHAASLTGSIDAESTTINATSGEPFYKGTYTFAQHIGYGVIDLAREGADLDITFKVNNVKIDSPAVYATYNVVNDIEELKAALNATAEGTNTIVFGADIEGNATVVQKPDVKITIDGDNHKFNGYIKVHSNSEHYASAAVTFKNINFETAKVLYNEDNEPYFNFIEALDNGAERYSTNITAEDCTFTATDEAVNTAVGLQIKSSKNAKVIGCTATNMHSLIQAQSCDESVLVQNCTVNGKNGVAFKQVKAATVENTTITATEYGIRFDGNTDNYGIVVKGNNITAAQPFIVRKMTGKNNTITLEGENTLTTEAAYQIVITNGQDDAEYVKPTGTYTMTGADNYTIFPAMPVAKVGNTEYTSIDDAIAAWTSTNNSTLTLLSNVTLSDVITLKSTEYHILDLGTYTMTAVKGKDAISITAEGRSSASYALDIKADATNPGGITATSKAVVKTTGKSGVKDRPIIRFYNGVYNASNVISHSGSNGTNCPQFQFHNGVYNANLSTNRALIQIYGGTFNGRFYTSVDSSAYMLISGGKFKYLDNLYGSALNSDKFTIGSSKGNFDRGVYVDDEGYFVVGGAVITEFGDMFAAKATNVSKAGTYLPYSSAATNGLYYTNADLAISKHGAANVEVKQ